jgi:hypothetical protein
VDENDKRLENGNEKSYIISVPEPEGVIEDFVGNYERPCFDISNVWVSIQGIHSR